MVQHQGVGEGIEICASCRDVFVLHLEGEVKGVVDDNRLGGLRPLWEEEGEIVVESVGLDEHEYGEGEGVSQQPYHFERGKVYPAQKGLFFVLGN